FDYRCCDHRLGTDLYRLMDFSAYTPHLDAQNARNRFGWSDTHFPTVEFLFGTLFSEMVLARTNRGQNQYPPEKMIREADRN
ncbi:hypothetical protein AVEN_27922-1, partial [Araneus ventricosus]